jgi:hypothetical protein
MRKCGYVIVKIGGAFQPFESAFPGFRTGKHLFFHVVKVLGCLVQTRVNKGFGGLGLNRKICGGQEATQHIREQFFHDIRGIKEGLALLPALSWLFIAISLYIA